MAVVTNIYGQPEPQYEGCVLYTFEKNGYNDSDWYAVCWDEEKHAVVTVNYDTTRCGGGGRADIDITDENLRKVYRFYKEDARNWFDTVCNPAQAKMIQVGDTIRVMRGRKIRKGTVGKVFWKGVCSNRYTYQDEERVGIEVGDQKVFLPAEYFVTCYWRDSRQSINDLLRDFLKKFDIQYLNTVNGDVWFKGSDGWHNARHEVLGKNVRFYALIYPGQEEAKT